MGVADDSLRLQRPGPRFTKNKNKKIKKYAETGVRLPAGSYYLFLQLLLFLHLSSVISPMFCYPWALIVLSTRYLQFLALKYYITDTW